MPLITTTEALTAFCSSLKGSKYIAVDTEFMRERTYWPKVCLIQVAGGDVAKAIDPLAEGMDLSPLLELLYDRNILKVFHAGRQDLEIFYNLTQQVPQPLFDTQIAAMVCGFGEAASFATLCSKLLKKEIDKSSRFTDWSYRPLSDKQVQYAMNDVVLLRPIYEKLVEMMHKAGRTAWVEEEMRAQLDPKLYMLEPMEAWLRLKLFSDKPRVRAVIRDLAAWRESEAQRVDVPRQRIMRDETLMEIANHSPSSLEELSRTRGLSKGYIDGPQGEQILALIERAKHLPQDQLPAGVPKKNLPSWIGPTVELLKVLLRYISDKHDVAPRLIATTDELELIAAKDTADVPALQGWRRELFGQHALRLKKGEITLGMERGAVKMFERAG